MKNCGSAPNLSRLATAFVAALLGLVAWSSVGQGEPAGPTSVVTVSGAKLLLDGQPFQVHGVEVDATNAPAAWFEHGRGGRGFPVYLEAYKHFAANAKSELAFARDSYGANTIEFSVSQPGFDVEDPTFTPSEHKSYISEIKNAVALARSMGFIVILTNLNSKLAGRTAEGLNYPDSATLRVDVALARMFGDDRAVLLELYSEPWPPAKQISREELWRQYIEGGPGRDGDSEIGVNAIIQDMRNAGAKNVILVQPFFPVGWNGYPGTIVDSGGEIAFGIHPYMNQTGRTRAQWQEYFGDFARAHPSVVTEWHENAGPMGRLGYAWCAGPDTLQLPREKLLYIDSVGVNGVVGWALDVPGTLLDKLQGTPTKLEECGVPGNDIGELLRDDFAGALPPQ